MKDLTVSVPTAICGARVMLPDELIETDIVIRDGRIETVGSAEGAERVIDARGLLLAPALIDIHGDAFERQMMPRPGVFFPIEAALLETDRQLAANGIATAYHALTLSWEPGLRSVEQGRALIDGLARLTPRLTVENRVQLRWETFATEAIDLIEEALASPLTPSIAFNDHTSMTMRGWDVPLQTRPFELSDAFEMIDFDDPRLESRIAGSARRSGLTNEDYLALMAEIWDRRPELDQNIRRIGAAGKAAGAPMLSHDDSHLETRGYFRSIGSRIAEFPMNMEVAKAARAAGDHIVFGAPNAVRGGSHIGSLGAGDMVEAGLCDVLASDYYYPAMLAAIARLDQESRAPRPKLWSLVSQGPARALGLDDRGEIAIGKRADLVLVDWPDGQTPAVRHTFVAGRTAYLAETLG